MAGTGPRFFRSTDTGAPTLTGNVGTLLTVLDALLINGYNSVTLTSITRSGATATATLNSHGFVTFQRVRISGAGQAEYNGDFYITNVTANTFDFTVTGTPATPATGTLACKVAPLDWTAAFNNLSNIKVYRTGTGSNRMYLNVDDSGTVAGATGTSAWMRASEIAMACDTGDSYANKKNAFPRAGDVYGVNGFTFLKAAAVSGSTQRWKALGDERCIHIITDVATTESPGTRSYFVFGDYISYYPNDIYATMIVGPINAVGPTGALVSTPLSASATQNNWYSARDWSGIHKSSALAPVHPQGASRWWATPTSSQYPNPANNELELDEFRMYENWGVAAGRKILRGKMPGIWTAGLNGVWTSDGDTFTGSGNLAGRQFIFYQMTNSQNNGVCWEISNTWNSA